MNVCVIQAEDRKAYEKTAELSEVHITGVEVWTSIVVGY